ncbi:MAG: HD-GYP domain-containing protein, partial [Salinispira sp.]
FEASSNMTAVQSVKTSIVSIILGQELHFPPHRLIELGISSLLHNIGMLKLPSELYMSDKILSEQERKVISTHPILAFKTLKAQQYPMNVCLAVLESHENMDGSGYPQHLNGAHINQYSKIIAICSSYAAMTSKRPFRISMNAYQAMLELLKMRDIRYDSHMLNVLVKSLSLYPIGTFVQIKNGAQGMVVNTQADKPRAPIIRLLRESTGEIYRKSSTVSTDKPEYQITAVLPPDKTTALKAALKH